MRLACAKQFCDPEIQNLHDPVVADHYVGGLDVPVDDPGGVGG